MKSETIVFFIAVPLFKFDDKINRLRIFNTFYTKQCLDINNTNAAKFDKMTGNIRRRAYQSDITDFTQLYNIIAYKTMSSFDQLQCSSSAASLLPIPLSPVIRIPSP